MQKPIPVVFAVEGYGLMHGAVMADDFAGVAEKLASDDFLDVRHTDGSYGRWRCSKIVGLLQQTDMAVAQSGLERSGIIMPGTRQ